MLCQYISANFTNKQLNEMCIQNVSQSICMKAGPTKRALSAPVQHRYYLLHKLTLQKELQQFETNNVLMDKKKKTQRQQNTKNQT